MLGEADLRSLLTEQGQISVACEFCGKRYAFDGVDVESLLATDALPPPSGTHH